jgi:hypothetical protein
VVEEVLYLMVGVSRRKGETDRERERESKNQI